MYVLFYTIVKPSKPYSLANIRTQIKLMKTLNVETILTAVFDNLKNPPCWIITFTIPATNSILHLCEGRSIWYNLGIPLA